MRSPLEVLTIHVDNNHALNTLWAYLLGPHRPELLYRLPSIVAGTAAILLAGLINVSQCGPVDLRSRRRAFAIAAILFAGSYLMVHYASEARGYSLAIALALTALLAGLREPVWRFGGWTFAYWVSICLALLAQPLSVHVLIGVAAWQAAECLPRDDRPTSRGHLRWLSWQAPPLVFLAFLYLFHLRFMTVLGGPRLNPFLVVGSAAAHTFGLPDSSILGLGVVVLASCAGFWAFIPTARFTWGHDRRLWVFYLTAGLIAPALLFVTTTDPLVYERYFIINFAVLLLLLAGALTKLASTRAAWIVAALLTLGIIGNSVPIRSLVEYGRGAYRVALSGIADRAEGTDITIGGDVDLRVGAMVAYYGPETVHPGQRMIYVLSGSDSIPEWYIQGWQKQDPTPPRTFTARSGAAYDFRGAFPYSQQLSGFNWAVYARVGAGQEP
jgi:hypothetical protein